MFIFVSTEAVDTMDLARVRRRRSVVRGFTALAPTVFLSRAFIFTGYV